MTEPIHEIRVDGTLYRVVTSNEYPPIPIRRFDWCAYVEGREECGNYGWGPTELDAINDLEAILESI